MVPGLVTSITNIIIKNDSNFNIFILGLAFMVFYTGFLPTNYISPVVVKSVASEDSSFTGDGYVSLAIIYAVFAFANWLAPSFVCAVGSKYSVVVGFSLVSTYILVFFNLQTWSLYFSSVLVGLGAACIWTGQGSLVTVNSTTETISRNSGIFWSMFECSLLFGNLIVYFQFYGLTQIDKETRILTFAEFLAIAVVGILLLFLIRPNATANGENQTASTTPTKAFISAIKLICTKEMLFLSLTFIHTGIELSFFSAVYGTCVGFTRQFGSIAKQLVGLSGVFIGIGEITGSFVFGVLGKWTLRFGRDVAFLFGYLIHLLAYYLIFLNLPDESPLHETDQVSFIPANGYVAMVCSFFLGFGDGCFNPQIISLLGSLYYEDSAPAFALYKFIQSVATAASLFYSSYIHLAIQLLILVFSSTFGLAAFCWIEWQHFTALKLKKQMTLEANHQQQQSGNACEI